MGGATGGVRGIYPPHYFEEGGGQGGTQNIFPEELWLVGMILFSLNEHLQLLCVLQTYKHCHSKKCNCYFVIEMFTVLHIHNVIGSPSCTNILQTLLRGNCIFVDYRDNRSLTFDQGF